MSTPADNSQHAKGPVKIDVDAVLRSRLGARMRYVPRCLVRGIERLICQDRLNAMLAEAYPRRGADFCRAVVEHIGVKFSVEGEHLLPADGRAVFVSNHPLGGLDGMALIDFVARHYPGSRPQFVVNDLLMAVEPLGDVFLPVNKHGVQSREAIRAIDDAFAGNEPILIFPAGLCSRRRGGVIADLPWHKMFVAKARESARPIVPIHFIARNSDRFYRLARLRERLGIKLNIEMVLLPGEMFRCSGGTIVCGSPIEPQSLTGDPAAEALRIRRIVDALSPQSSIRQPL